MSDVVDSTVAGVDADPTFDVGIERLIMKPLGGQNSGHVLLVKRDGVFQVGDHGVGPASDRSLQPFGLIGGYVEVASDHSVHA